MYNSGSLGQELDIVIDIDIFSKLPSCAILILSLVDIDTMLAVRKLWNIAC